MIYTLPDSDVTPERFNARGAGTLPGHLNIVVTYAGRDRFEAYFDIQKHHHAPNGFLHAGGIVTLADSLCGYGTVANIRDGATGFTTIELKSNFFSTALEGRVFAVATPVHIGSSTQVWDCEVTSDKGKRMALFRCSQMVLRPKA
jgi:1,4-dihydroxy-2-naphthoyl-CoA hydrolase